MERCTLKTVGGRRYHKCRRPAVGSLQPWFGWSQVKEEVRMAGLAVI